MTTNTKTAAAVAVAALENAKRGARKAPTTTRISAASVQVGDVMWFSGYWVRVTEVRADGGVYGCWEGRSGTIPGWSGLMYTISKWTELVYLGLTIKL